MSNERNFDASKTLKKLAKEGWTVGELFAAFNAWKSGNEQEIKGDCIELSKRVSNILNDIGVPRHLLGYMYVRKAIVLVTEKRSYIKKTTTELYPIVAKEFATTAPRVERAIRNAIELAWERGNLDAINKYFGNTVSYNKGRPTNSEFMAMIADILNLEGYGAEQ